MIEKVPIDSIHPPLRNARTHDTRNLAAIQASLKEFGWVDPAVVGADGETILSGSGRWYAAKALGWTEATILRTTLAGPAAVAYAIAANRTAELAAWDDAILADQLAGLTTADEHLALITGFSQAELEQLIARVSGITRQPDADDPPPPPERPVSEPGKTYRLGRHRITCGDGADEATILRLVGKNRVHLLITDPPYNVDYTGKTAEALKIEGDKMPDPQFRAFLARAFKAADKAMRLGAVFYIWHADSEGFNFRAAIHDAGWPIRQTLIWQKQTMVLGRQDYQWRHEPCLYGWKPGKAHQWNADRKQTTIPKARIDWALRPAADGSGYFVTIDGATYLIQGTDLSVAKTETTLLEFDRPLRSTDHPTMKPAALFEYQILNSTKRDQAVLDPFAGSGTTAIAAEKTNRTAYLVEIDPRYCDVTRRRWAEFTAGPGADWEVITRED